MRTKDRRELVSAVQVFQKFEDHLAGPKIEIAGRLIGEQNAGLSHQRAGQHDPLLLSTR